MIPPGDWTIYSATPWVLDTPYINLISVTGENDVRMFGNAATITADNIRINGLSFSGGGLYVCGDYPGLVIEKCGGYLKGNYDGPPVKFSGTVKNCDIGSGQFLSDNGFSELSGRFENVSGTSSLFNLSIYGETTLSGTFINCSSTQGGFMNAKHLTGKFINCTGEYNSFVGNLGGTFINCKANSGSFTNDFTNGTITGSFTNCIGGQSSFSLTYSGRNNNGNYYYCQAGSGSFRASTFSGNAYYCICNGSGFGSGSITGNIVGCSSEYAFGTITSGSVINCTAKYGVFVAPTGGGRLINCVDQLTTGAPDIVEEIIDMKPGEYLSDIIESITDASNIKRYTINFYNHSKTMNWSTFTEKILVPANIYINFVGDIELWPNDHVVGGDSILFNPSGDDFSKTMLGFSFSRENEYSFVIKSGLPSNLSNVCFSFLDNKFDVVANYDVLISEPELHGLGTYGLDDGLVFVKGDPLVDARNRKLYKKKNGIFTDVTPEFNNVNFSGFDFRFAYLLGAKNNGATFKCADNRWANMQYSDNTSADFSYTDNRCARFSNTINSLAQFAGADNRRAGFSHSVSTGMDLSYANNTYADFSNSNMPQTSFNRSINEETDFSGTNLTDAVWTDVVSIKNSKFIGAILTGGTSLPDRINTKAKWIAECGAANVDSTTLWIDGTSILS